MKKITIITIIIVVIDQLSKFYIKTNFEIGESLTIFRDWFHLLFVENPGMAYGMNWGGATGKTILAISRWFFIFAMIYFITHQGKKMQKPIFNWTAGLLLAGALGNVLDSTFYGLIFNSGTTWNPEIQDWNRFYEGVSKADFTGYAPLFQGCVVDMLYFPLFDYSIPDGIPLIGGKQGTFFSPIFNIADSAITIGAVIILFFHERIFKIN